MEPLWISAGTTIILACITGYYASLTKKIAGASENAARAAVEQTDALKQQRINASQPTLWPMIWGWTSNKLEVICQNIGNGPALDIDIYLGRGENPIISDCEHKRYSYLVAGDKEEHFFLVQWGECGPMGLDLLASSVIDNLLGKYTLLVEWRDLYKSGPFFQAKLPFNLERDLDGKLCVKEGVVVISSIPERIIMEDETGK
jgi:hypothetical protein